MKVFTDIDAITSIPHPVLTIGTFDGVHLGHQQIIQQLNREASKIEGESVLFTFYPHPRMVVYPETHGLKLLQTQEEKLEKLERMGLQNVIVYPFNFEFSRLSATEFIRDYLVKKLQVKKLVIGYDHQFGRNREGTIDFLKTISEIYEFDVIEIPPEEIDAINISSTKIRDSLLEGKVDNAALFLGEPFCLQGKVIKGDQLGRTIGFPTANIALNAAEKIIPANGVYAVTAKINGRLYTGMMNIGRRPTIKGIENDLRLEVHLFDFSDTLYDQNLEIYFWRYIRSEQMFDTIQLLRQQLEQDEKVARTLLADLV